MTKQMMVMISLLWIPMVLADAYQEGQAFGLGLNLPSIKTIKQEDLNALVPGFDNHTKTQFGSLNDDNIERVGEQAAQMGGMKELIDEQRVMLDDQINTAPWEVDETALDNVNEDVFCQSGICEGLELSSSTDFGNSISYLSAADAAGNDVHKVGFIFKYEQLFVGVPLGCRKTVAQYNNCCKDKGWGQGIHLAGCNDEEKQLSHDKEQKFCHYVGEYCKTSTPIGHTCLEKKKVYCCFGSILARIVVEGAHQQLTWPWGDAKAPVCRGLSATQLSLIDFEKLDFSDYEETVNNKMKEPTRDDLISHLQMELNG